MSLVKAYRKFLFSAPEHDSFPLMFKLTHNLKANYQLHLGEKWSHILFWLHLCVNQPIYKANYQFLLAMGEMATNFILVAFV